MNAIRTCRKEVQCNVHMYILASDLKYVYVTAARICGSLWGRQVQYVKVYTVSLMPSNSTLMQEH